MILLLIHQERVSEEVWCILGFGWLRSHCAHLHRTRWLGKMVLIYFEKMEYWGVSAASFPMMGKKCKSKVNWRETASKTPSQLISTWAHIHGTTTKKITLNKELGPRTLRWRGRGILLFHERGGAGRVRRNREILVKKGLGLLPFEDFIFFLPPKS